MHLLLLTANFPFLPGEQFLEDEIGYLAAVPGCQLTIAPMRRQGATRSLPQGVAVDTGIADTGFAVRDFLGALFSPILFREILYLRYSGALSTTTALEACKAVVRIERVMRGLRKIIGKLHDSRTVVYSYWNDTSAYAACVAKRSGLVSRVVSRAHRFDLYQEQRPVSYMPLKRQFVKDHDEIHLISEQARRYFAMTYGDGNLKVSRLGVPVPDRVGEPSQDGVFRILTVSNCIPVKRLDRILDGIAEVSGHNPRLQVAWTHFGAGPLLEEMKRRATEVAAIHANLSIDMPGAVSNAEVRAFMRDTPCDVFINASESEGVPVSIIEAMSFGIPIVATDVGGVSELVVAGTGILLPGDVSPDGIADAIQEILSSPDNLAMRIACREKICRDYDASANYADFASGLARWAAH